MAVLRTT